MSREPAGEAGARERSAGWSRAGPGSSLPAPAGRRRQPRASRPAPRSLQRLPRAGEIGGRARLAERLPTAPRRRRRAQERSGRAALLERRDRRAGSPRRPPGRSRRRRGAPSSSSLSLLPPSAHGLLCPVAAAAASLLAPHGSALSSPPRPPVARRPPGTLLEAPPYRAGPARRGSGPEAAGERGRAPSEGAIPPRAWPRPSWMCARPGLLAPAAAAVVGSGSRASAFRLWRGKERLWRTKPGRSWAFALRVFGWFFPWSLTVPHREPCCGTKP